MLATGDELVPPGTDAGPGQIVYSNGFALMALARGEGAEVIDLGIVPDRLEETVAGVRKARATQRRRAGHDRRRVGRRLRPGAARLGGGRPGAVVLEESRCGPAGR